MSAVLEQLQFESMTWSRSLEFFKQENTHLKDRLTEVVDKISDKSFLAHAEHFQNQFIIKDEFIDELKHDVNEQTRMIREYNRKYGSVNNPPLDLKAIQETLREQMQYLEKDFAVLKNEFHQYLVNGHW